MVNRNMSLGYHTTCTAAAAEGIEANTAVACLQQQPQQQYRNVYHGRKSTTASEAATSVAMRRILTASLLLLLLYLLPQANSTVILETCQTESFYAECAPDEVIVMTSARYGRMKLGRCVKHDVLSLLGCQSDVLTIMDSMCSGRRSCSVRIPDPELDELSPCLDELKSYLEASYTCYKVIAPMNSCSDTTPIRLDQPEGFLSSYIASNTGCGLEKAPWILQAPPGQLINISFYEFNLVEKDYMETAATSAQCLERAFLMDSQKGRKIKICPRSRRISDVYISTNNSLDVTFRTRSVLEEGNHFLIHYKFFGCADKAPIAGMIFERTGTLTGTMSCVNTPQSFQLSCIEGQWKGQLDTCIEVGSNAQDENSAPHVVSGIVVIGLVAICVILMSVIIAIFIFCIKRIRHTSGHLHDGYIYDESPYGKGGKIHTPQCTLKQLHVEMEPCGACNSDNDTIYKPFLHNNKNHPQGCGPLNGMIQNQISVNSTNAISPMTNTTTLSDQQPCLACSENNRENSITEEELNLRNAAAYLQQQNQLHHTLPSSTRPVVYDHTNTSPVYVHKAGTLPLKESNLHNDINSRFSKLLNHQNSSGNKSGGDATPPTSKNKKDRPMTLFGTSGKKDKQLNKSKDCLQLQQGNNANPSSAEYQHHPMDDFPPPPPPNTQFPSQIVYDLAPGSMYPKNYASGAFAKAHQHNPQHRPREPIYVPPPAAPPSVDLLNNTL